MNFKTIGLREELRNCRPTVHVESPEAAFADVLVEFAIGPRGQGSPRRALRPRSRVTRTSDVRQDALAEEPDRLHDLFVGRPTRMGVA